jgi:hypothetical protein
MLIAEAGRAKGLGEARPPFAVLNVMPPADETEERFGVPIRREDGC